jgi:plasmid stabilization system protein ParE
MMPFPIIIEPMAKEDIREAKQWLDNQKPGLSEQFAIELDTIFDRIANNPLAYATVERRTRQVRLPIMTYVVSYILLDEKVHVTAILHGHRDRSRNFNHMSEKYIHKDIPEIRSSHRRAVALAALILLGCAIAWPYFDSVLIPLFAFLVLGLIIIPQLRRQLQTKCKTCGNTIERNSFERNIPIVFKCDHCKTIWDTGWHFPSSDYWP